MSLDRDLNRLSTSELIHRLRGDLLPLNSKVSYFFAALPVSEEDVEEYLREPFDALPPSLLQALPPISVVMVPYLERVAEKGNGRKTEDFVRFDKPGERDRTWSSKLLLDDHVDFAAGGKLVYMGDEMPIHSPFVAERRHAHAPTATAVLAATTLSGDARSRTLYHAMAEK